ncbi:MAG: hypothetical protein ACPKPY_00695 [Nitrososphaeraceae archaeon]
MANNYIKNIQTFSTKNLIKEKPIPNVYPQLQGKIEGYNKIVRDEFLTVENSSDKEEGKKRYSMFVKAYNEQREEVGVSMAIHH